MRLNELCGKFINKMLDYDEFIIFISLSVIISSVEILRIIRFK